MAAIDGVFTSRQREEVAAAVQSVERETACEIIPVVAEASGRYDRAEDMVGLWCAVLAGVAVWVWFPRAPVDGGTGTWGTGAGGWGALVLALGIVGGFLIGALMGSRVHWLRRLATPDQQRQEEVARRAREVFFDQRIHHTTGRTGILLYVSLFEHGVAVLADRDVLDHPQLGPAFLERTRDALLAGLSRQPPAEALVQAIRDAGSSLSAALPRHEQDANEHPDALVLLSGP